MQLIELKKEAANLNEQRYGPPELKIILNATLLRYNIVWITFVFQASVTFLNQEQFYTAKPWRWRESRKEKTDVYLI